jgi:hypothetical protein
MPPQLGYGHESSGYLLFSLSSVNLILRKRNRSKYIVYVCVSTASMSKTREKEKMEPDRKGDERLQKDTGLHNEIN